MTQQCELGGRTYTLRCLWNDRARCWHLDVATVDGTPIVTGVRLVTAFPLLQRCVHADRPAGDLVLLDLLGQGGVPTSADLGTRFALFYVEAA